MKSQQLLSAAHTGQKELKMMLIKGLDILSAVPETTIPSALLKDIGRTRQELLLIDKALAEINTGALGHY